MVCFTLYHLLLHIFINTKHFPIGVHHRMVVGGRFLPVPDVRRERSGVPGPVGHLPGPAPVPSMLRSVDYLYFHWKYR